MKVIKDTTKITLNVTNKELISNKFIPVTVVSEKLKALEVEKEMANKALRYKFYNTANSNRYNTSTFAGIKCIDIEKPMLKLASLELEFKVVEDEQK